MNWDVIEGNWKQLWGKLNDDQIDAIAGKRDQWAGKIREASGVTKEETEIQIKSFEERNKGCGAS